MPEGVKKGAFFSLLGLGTGGVLLFLFNVIAARVLGPSRYGVLNVLYSLITVITPLLSAGIRLGNAKFISAFEAKNEREKIQATIRNSLVLLICFLLLFLIVVLILRNSIQNKYLNHSLFLFLVFIFSIFVRAFVNLARGVLQGLREFKYRALSLVIEYSSMLILLLVFVVLFELGVNGASASLFGSMAITLVASFFICYKFRSRLTNDNQEKGGVNLGRFFQFAAPVALANFLSFVLFKSGPFLIKTFGGLDADKLAGLFASAFALVSVIRMFVVPLSGALFPNLSRAEALGNVKLQRRYIKNSILFVTAMSMTMLLIFWLLGPFILKTIYGKEFLLKRLDIVLIVSMGGFYFLAQLLSTILFAKGLTNDVLLSCVIGACCLILFIWLVRVNTLLRVEGGLCIGNFVAFTMMLVRLRIKEGSYSK